MTAVMQQLLVGGSATAWLMTDTRTLGVIAVLSMATAALVGVTTFVVHKRGDLARSLRAGVRVSAEGRRLRAGLLFVQSTLSVVQGVRFAAAGALLGVVAALTMSRWIQPVLFRQPAVDPVIYTAVAAIIVVVALLASAVPALTAVRSDANAALRAE